MGVVIEKLQEILACRCVDISMGDRAYLDEKNNENALRPGDLKKVVMSGITDHVLLINVAGSVYARRGGLRVNRSYAPVFKDATERVGLLKSCDAVLIRETDNLKCSLVFIELKSRDVSGASTQLKSTKCFFDYCRSILSHFYEIDADFEDATCIVFHTRRGLDKKATGYRGPSKPSQDFGSPAKRAVTDGEEVNVNELFRR